MKQKSFTIFIWRCCQKLWNTGSGIMQAKQFISDNLNDGEKLIIYGYSAGGVAAHKLSESLNERNIKVDLLLTVDAAFSIGSSFINRQLPGNVGFNLNYFQITPSFPFLSKGGKNYTKSRSTLIKNIEVNTGHSDIDEKSQIQIENEIKGK